MIVFCNAPNLLAYEREEGGDVLGSLLLMRTACPPPFLSLCCFFNVAAVPVPPFFSFPFLNLRLFDARIGMMMMMMMMVRSAANLLCT